MLFELQLLLLRLAWENYPKDQERKDLSLVFDRYFKYLYFRKNEDLATSAFPDINRKMIAQMKEYYRVINNEIKSEGDSPIEGAVQMTPLEQLANKMQKDINDASPIGLDFPELLKALDKELPKMPPMPVV